MTALKPSPEATMRRLIKDVVARAHELGVTPSDFLEMCIAAIALQYPQSRER
jgi:hypothetical protein